MFPLVRLVYLLSTALPSIMPFPRARVGGSVTSSSLDDDDDDNDDAIHRMRAGLARLGLLSGLIFLLFLSSSSS